MTLRLALLGAALAPALASAEPADPHAPAPARPVMSTQTVAQAPMPAPGAQSPPSVIITPAEPTYEEVHDAYNAPMVTTGALVFAASYGASVVVAATAANDRANNRLYVPIAGPWLALNDRGPCDTTRSSCDQETTAKVLLIADGVFQAAGIVGVISGMLQPTSHREITSSARRDTKLHVRPTLVRGTPGFGVFSHF
jgi:hypothetical protein